MPELTDTELTEAIIARNRRDMAKTFTLGGKGTVLVDRMEWESLHSRLLRAEADLKAARERELAERRYDHHPFCNSSRKFPAGVSVDGCSCSLFMRAEVRKIEDERRKFEDKLAEAVALLREQRNYKFHMGINRRTDKFLARHDGERKDGV